MSPEFKEAVKIAATGEYKCIPVSLELYADQYTPLMVLRKLKNVSRHCYMLESAEDNQKWGRYTFLGYDPRLEITCTNGKLTIKNGTSVNMETKHPGEYIRQILDENKSPKIEGFPTFTGGLVGYFSYDYMKYAEPSLVLDAEDKEGFKDVDLMLFDKVIAFDHFRQKIILIVNIRCEDLKTEYHRAELELSTMKQLIQSGEMAEEIPGRCTSEFRALFNQKQYCSMVEKAKHYIREGDIFQVVLSNRMEVDYEGSLLDTYRVLRTVNPSPYMFYFSSDDMEIAGASPETLVKLENKTLHTFPLAGTRPRGATEAEDQRLEQELLADEKECSEHNMLVDLGRNDLGRVAKPGSVKLERLMEIERFSHVMHMTSRVTAQVNDGLGVLDILGAAFPAGTVSGAPKVRAMEILAEEEPLPRGPYAGCIGWLGLDKNGVHMDSGITIRSMWVKDGRIHWQTGAGIVYDSDPAAEWQECMNKGKIIDVILKGEDHVSVH